MPPSPVSIQQPASAAPRDSARTAGAEIAPKLMPLMLTIERASNGLLAIALADHERRRRQAFSPPAPGTAAFTKRIAPGALHVVGRAEADDAALVLLRHAVDPAARRAVERHLVAVAGEEVLAEVFALLLEEVAQVPDDRVVAQHRVLLLRDVLDEQEHDHREERRSRAACRRRLKECLQLRS